MNYRKVKQILSRKADKCKGYWSKNLCLDCDCNFLVYETIITSSWKCPNCQSKQIVGIKTIIGNGEPMIVAHELIDLTKFDKVHLPLTLPLATSDKSEGT